MSIESALEDHFAAWRTYYGAQAHRFVADGVIGSHSEYSSSPRRLLFLLKEAHDRNGILDACGFDLRVLFREPGRFTGHSKTVERRLAQWTQDIWDVISRTSPHVTEPIRSVAVMNLKKLAGGACTIDHELKDATLRDRWFILEQIRLLEPQVMICGGTFLFLRQIQPEWTAIDERHLLFRRESTILLNHHHPSAWATAARRHRDMMAALSHAV